ncbi:MAG: fluoride efflux transporter CrcB [Pseudomonadota bacterium]
MGLTVVYVALGGALGAALRYLLGVGIYRLTGGPTGFPIAILTVNVLGSVAMGVFVVLAAQRGLLHYAPFIMIGLLGGFTTFSSFSLETVRLIEEGHWGHAGLYIVLSVILSVGGLVAGMWMTRTVMS